MKHARVTGMAMGLVVLAASGCGVFSDPTKKAAATVSSSVIATSTPSPSGPSSSSMSPSATPSATRSSSTPKPTGTGGTILDPTVTGRELTTADAFAFYGDWKDDRYNVATLKDVKGMGVRVDNCSVGTWTKRMELRLENGFNRLTFTAGQGNASPSSSQVLKVEVLGDQRQLEIRNIPFNQTQDFVVTVTGVNSLKIWLYMERSPSGCEGQVDGVLMSMKLS